MQTLLSEISRQYADKVQDIIKRLYIYEGCEGKLGEKNFTLKGNRAFYLFRSLVFCTFALSPIP